MCLEAVERYNELRVKVRADRIAQSAFDVKYLAWKKELEEGKRKSRRANAEEPRVVLAENDLSEDERG